MIEGASRELARHVSAFFTIGHATRTLDQFVELLMESRIGMVVDVRSMPASRTNPQFNRDVLPTSLQDYQIGYRHIAALGGLRKSRCRKRSRRTTIGE